MISDENPISIGWKGVQLQPIKEIQVSCQMTTYGQNWECFRTKYVIITSSWRISWRKTCLAPHTVSQKKYKFEFMQRCPCSCANTFIVFAFKILLSLTMYGHLAGNLNFFDKL